MGAEHGIILLLRVVRHHAVPEIMLLPAGMLAAAAVGSHIFQTCRHRKHRGGFSLSAVGAEGDDIAVIFGQGKAAAGGKRRDTAVTGFLSSAAVPLLHPAARVLVGARNDVRDRARRALVGVIKKRGIVINVHADRAVLVARLYLDLKAALFIFHCSPQ